MARVKNHLDERVTYKTTAACRRFPATTEISTCSEQRTLWFSQQMHSEDVTGSAYLSLRDIFSLLVRHNCGAVPKYGGMTSFDSDDQESYTRPLVVISLRISARVMEFLTLRC